MLAGAVWDEFLEQSHRKLGIDYEFDIFMNLATHLSYLVRGALRRLEFIVILGSKHNWTPNPAKEKFMIITNTNNVAFRHYICHKMASLPKTS